MVAGFASAVLFIYAHVLPTHAHVLPGFWTLSDSFVSEPHTHVNWFSWVTAVLEIIIVDRVRCSLSTSSNERRASLTSSTSIESERAATTPTAALRPMAASPRETLRCEARPRRPFDGRSNGLSACARSSRRSAPNTMPVMISSTAGHPREPVDVRVRLGHEAVAEGPEPGQHVRVRGQHVRVYEQDGAGESGDHRGVRCPPDAPKHQDDGDQDDDRPDAAGDITAVGEASRPRRT